MIQRPPTRLYGEPGAETLHTSLEAAAQRAYDIREWTDAPSFAEIELEEYTVLHPGTHLPAADAIIEWIEETVGEDGMTTEDGYDEISEALRSPLVTVLLDAVREAVAERVMYRMADEHVSTRPVWLVHAPSGEPSFTFGNAVPVAASALR